MARIEAGDLPVLVVENKGQRIGVAHFKTHAAFHHSAPFSLPHRFDAKLLYLAIYPNLKIAKQKVEFVFMPLTYLDFQ